VFEQPTVAERIADSLLEVLELVAKADDALRGALGPMAGDDLDGFVLVRDGADVPAAKRRRASPSGAQGSNKGVAGRCPALGFI